MISSKRSSLFWIILGIVALFLVFSIRIKDEMVDFEVNYKAGKRLSSGETLYRIEDGHYQFKYSPFSALLYVPLSFIPLTAAKAIWYVVIILSSFFLILLCRNLCHIQHRSFLYTLFPLLILARYFLRELQLGQINTFISMLLVLMIWILISEEKKFPPSRAACWGGAIWGLASALKPYALIFLPYLILKKKWKSLLSGLIFLALSLIVPSFFYGFSGNIRVLREWISSFSLSTPSLLDSQDNISFLGILMKWAGNQKLSLLVFATGVSLLAFLLLILVLRGKGRKEALLLDCSILLVLIPLISPLGWDYTLLISILGVMICAVHFFDYSKFWRGFLILNFSIVAFSLYDLLGREFYARFMSWSVITINFLILIGYLAFLRWRGLR